MKMTEARRRNLVRREKEVKLAECRPASAMRRAIEKYHEACRQPDAPFISSYGFLLEYAGLGRRGLVDLGMMNKNQEHLLERS